MGSRRSNRRPKLNSMRGVFGDREQLQPELISRRTIAYAVDQRSTKFLSGYELFLDSVPDESRALNSVELAIEAIDAATGRLLADPATLRAAAIFFGNMLSREAEDARWVAFDADSLEVWRGGNGVDVVECVGRCCRGSIDLRTVAAAFLGPRTGRPL